MEFIESIKIIFCLFIKLWYFWDMISFFCNFLWLWINGVERDYYRVDFNIYILIYKVKYLGCEMLFSLGVLEICDIVKVIFSLKKEEFKFMDYYLLKMIK